ncbi:FadR/GntR family transcriptional regulator [Geobacillus thermodenitrificans]|uniref:FadR/GntR family transcriptional regulator n=1 Tax=Geobacillus thermodenitrificans TaxID=33940 RepID=UPI0004020577|nr:FadR/GntR family transcriptional regulator [Geobacillus thermodenitrificans]
MIITEIQQYIEKNQLKKGDRLPSVAQLTKMLNVSRSSLREALRFMEAVGTIEVINGKGIYVKDDCDSLRIEAKIELENEKQLLLQISEVRRALEGKAVELAVARATKEEIYLMENHLMEALRLKDLGLDSSKEDWAFHKTIYQASHNPVLQSVLESVSDTFNKLWSKPFGIEKIFEDTYPFHLSLLEAIKQRDAERALKEFNKIIDSVENTISNI